MKWRMRENVRLTSTMAGGGLLMDELSSMTWLLMVVMVTILLVSASLFIVQVADEDEAHSTASAECKKTS